MCFVLLIILQSVKKETTKFSISKSVNLGLFRTLNGAVLDTSTLWLARPTICSVFPLECAPTLRILTLQIYTVSLDVCKITFKIWLDSNYRIEFIQKIFDGTIVSSFISSCPIYGRHPCQYSICNLSAVWACAALKNYEFSVLNYANHPYSKIIKQTNCNSVF